MSNEKSRTFKSSELQHALRAIAHQNHSFPKGHSNTLVIAPMETLFTDFRQPTSLLNSLKEGDEIWFTSPTEEFERFTIDTRTENFYMSKRFNAAHHKTHTFEEGGSNSSGSRPFTPEAVEILFKRYSHATCVLLCVKSSSATALVAYVGKNFQPLSHYWKDTIGEWIKGEAIFTEARAFVMAS